MLTNTRALIAVGNPETRKQLYGQLLDRGVFSDYAGDGQVTLQRLREIPYGIVVLDLALTKISSLQIIDTIGEMSPRPMIIAVAGEDPYPTLDSEIVQIVVRMPFPLHELAGIIASCVVPSKRREQRAQSGDDAREERSRNRF